MIQHNCPQCSSPLESPQSMAGQQDQCPSCGRQITIPAMTPRSGGLSALAHRYWQSGVPPWLNTALSSVALLMAILAVVFTISRDNPVPGKGLKAYDLSTPKEALRSRMQMEANADILADVEMRVARAKSQHSKAQEHVDTLEFGRIVEHDGKVLVLYKYMEGGLPQYDSSWFEKSGRYFFPTYVYTLDWEDEGGKKAELAELIAEWEAQEYQ